MKQWKDRKTLFMGTGLLFAFVVAAFADVMAPATEAVQEKFVFFSFLSSP